MKLVITTLITCLVLILGFIYFKPEYRSAFEADQDCHFDLSNYSLDNNNLGCDHDLETRQWLLFNSEESNKPAIIMKRYRY